MFEADDSWRCSRSDILEGLFPQSGIQRYRLVEISLNVQIFHLDILIESCDGLYWSRYLVDTFRDVLEFVNVAGISEYRVSVQSARSDASSYCIQEIQQVFEIKDHPGAYFYGFDDGTFLPDSLHEFPFVTRNLRLVWSSDMR